MTNEPMTNDQWFIGIWDLVIESLKELGFGHWEIGHW